MPFASALQGYLLKDTDSARLPPRIARRARGRGTLRRRLVARLIEEFRERDRRKRLPLLGQRGVELTSQGGETLRLMHQGLTTAEIAKQLFISKVTVRTHITAIVKKLRVSDRQAALRLLDEQ